jgi:Flp pilus assembly pilin Flp
VQIACTQKENCFMTKIFTRINAALAARGMEREEGQGVVEYALVLGVLVVVIFVGFTATNIGTEVTAVLGNIVTRLQTVV